MNKIFASAIILALVPSLAFAQVRDSGYAGQMRRLKTAKDDLQVYSNNHRVYMVKSMALRPERVKSSQSRRTPTRRKPTSVMLRALQSQKDKALITDSATAANLFLQRNSQYFGVSSSNLVLQSSDLDRLGKVHNRYSEHCDYDVYGAEIVTHLNSSLAVESVNGNASACPAKQRIVIGKTAARDFALNYFWGTQGGWDGAAPKTSIIKTAYFIPNLFTTFSSSADQWPLQYDVNKTYLTYIVQVGGDATHAAGTYFIDVLDGSWRYYIPAAQGLNRQVYDCAGGTSSSGCGMSRSEGQAPVAQSDVNLWYDDFSGVTAFLLATVGRNGANNVGGLTPGNDTAVAYVNYGASYFAPVLGGSQYLPPSMTSNTRIETTHEWTDPASFAHEYFHGVEYFTHPPSGMTYSTQSGALMEAGSNVFAEAYNQATYGSGPNDWKIIFSSPDVDQGSYPQGFHVDMTHPEYDSSIYGAYGDPDSMYSRDYYCGSTSVDNGGVHANSYPITKATWLLAKGGNFNNCEIQAIGLDKVHQIWYRAMANYFTVSAPFSEAYTDLQSACNDLYPAPSTVCAQVTAALQAVEFNQAGRCTTTTARAVPACAPSSCVTHPGGDSVSVTPYVTYLTRTYRDRCLEGNLWIHHSCTNESPSRLTYNYQICNGACGDNICRQP